MYHPDKVKVSSSNLDMSTKNNIMVDSFSKYAMENGYRCFGKAKSSDSCLYKDLTDITDYPSKIYFSTMNNLQFVFRKEGCKEFRIYLLDGGYGISYEGCDNLHGFSKGWSINKEGKVSSNIKTSGSFSTSAYYGLKNNFTNEEILEIIDKSVELYFNENGKLITKEEYLNVGNA